MTGIFTARVARTIACLMAIGLLAACGTVSSAVGVTTSVVGGAVGVAGSAVGTSVDVVTGL